MLFIEVLFARTLSLFLWCALLGCNNEGYLSNSPSPESPIPKDQRKIQDYVLKIPLNGDITTLDPSLTEDTGSIELVEQLFLGLTDFTPDTYEAAPKLATHWTVHDDGLRYRFYLRKDAFWSDGTPVTAKDVVWSLQHNIRPENKSSYTALLYVLKNAKELHEGKLTDVNLIGAKVLDDHTVEFTLAYKASYFPKIVSTWIYRPLPQQVIAQYGSDWTQPEHIQTNGPYQLRDWKKGQYLLLTKNKRFFGADQVNIETVKYIIVTESSIALSMYEYHELDILGGNYLPIPADSIQKFRADPRFANQFKLSPQPCAEYYVLNTERPPLDNLLVRKAIMNAIDRQLLIDLVLDGKAIAANQFLPPLILKTKLRKENTFNPEQARLWLKEAGYTGEIRPLTLIYNESERYQHIAIAVKTMLKHYLNIDIEPQSLSWENYLTRMNSQKDVDLYRFGWCGDYPDPNNWLNDVFNMLKGHHQAHWIKPAFITFIEKAGKELDPEQRQELYRQAEQELMTENLTILPIYFDIAQYLVKPWIKNWYAMPTGGQPIYRWSIKYDHGAAQNP